jgi:hypothetical protein
MRSGGRFQAKIPAMELSKTTTVKTVVMDRRMLDAATYSYCWRILVRMFPSVEGSDHVYTTSMDTSSEEYLVCIVYGRIK